MKKNLITSPNQKSISICFKRIASYFLLILYLSFIDCNERLRTVRGESKETLVLCPLFTTGAKAKEESRSIRHLIGSSFLTKGFSLVFWEDSWGECKLLPKTMRLIGDVVEKEDFRTGKKTWFVGVTLSEENRAGIHSSFWSDKEPYQNQKVWIQMGEELWENWELSKPKKSVLLSGK